MAAERLKQPISAVSRPELLGAARDKPQVRVAQLADIYMRFRRMFPESKFLIFGGAAVKMLCGDRPISDLDLMTDIAERNNVPGIRFTELGVQVLEGDRDPKELKEMAEANGFEVSLRMPWNFELLPTPTFDLSFIDKETSLEVTLCFARELFTMHMAVTADSKNAPIFERPYERDFLGPDGQRIRVGFVHPTLLIINKGMTSFSEMRRAGEKWNRNQMDLWALLQAFYDGDVEKFIRKEASAIKRTSKPPKTADEHYTHAQIHEIQERGEDELRKRAAEGRRLTLKMAAEEARRPS